MFRNLTNVLQQWGKKWSNQQNWGSRFVTDWNIFMSENNSTTSKRIHWMTYSFQLRIDNFIIQLLFFRWTFRSYQINSWHIFCRTKFCLTWDNFYVMTISEGFLWNFEDIINFASKIYCLKITSNDGTDFEKKNTINGALMGSDWFSITEIKLSIGKK